MPGNWMGFTTTLRYTTICSQSQVLTHQINTPNIYSHSTAFGTQASITVIIYKEHPQAAQASLASRGSPLSSTTECADTRSPTDEKDYCACGPHTFKISIKSGGNYRPLLTRET